MMIMTAKVNIKKVLIVLGAIAALLIGIIALFGGEESTATSATVSDNDSRVQFLKDLGWQVTTSPKESSQVKIPTEQSPAYSRYNDLQKSQGYDLSRYAGKTVMRYVYDVQNSPNAQQPVYATLLVYKNQIIGGDITDSAANGAIRGLAKPEATSPTTLPAESSLPTE